MHRICQISTSVFLSVFLTFPFLFAQTINVATYDELVHAIRETRHASEQRIESAVEQEKVREAWETGKLIHEHILLHKDRAEYGQQVLKRLSADLETSPTELGYMVQFAKAYPIYRTSGKLSWGHYETLLAVNDAKERDEIESHASREKWSVDDLRKEIKRRKVSVTKTPDEKLQDIKPGKLHTYRIVKAAHGTYKGELVVDLGFSSYYKPDQDLKLDEGDIVTVSKEGSRYTLNAERLPLDVLYTYSADVIQVIDGDTFHASIDLGFGFTMTQRVRLKRVDAPEILTSEGKEAKAALEKLLKKGSVIIQSIEQDQHGRPLAIVWAGDTLVDQAMLEKKLVIKLTE